MCCRGAWPGQRVGHKNGAACMASDAQEGGQQPTVCNKENIQLRGSHKGQQLREAAGRQDCPPAPGDLLSL